MVLDEGFQSHQLVLLIDTVMFKMLESIIKAVSVIHIRILSYKVYILCSTVSQLPLQGMFSRPCLERDSRLHLNAGAYLVLLARESASRTSIDT
jgi:hypothetical protein